MPDKEVIQAVLDAVGLTRTGRTEPKNRCHEEEECVAPDRVIYVIFCKCVTINNGACEDWEFCKAGNSCGG